MMSFSHLIHSVIQKEPRNGQKIKNYCYGILFQFFQHFLILLDAGVRKYETDYNNNKYKSLSHLLM